ncbi:DUF2244 domain-containing protein [Cognatishimia sp. F0-27]|uniref:DUF2244 domain-containing protein n=1 Tax=Cognatishimia sp. F0-27 TaxID=2816855 RepID=UPI001D0C73E4|nr:DUF2244 domain-containing protein [Cognatishimia sp. F0-27]MCC1494572.1 DUF2244 domain-containing protein [Cognatishimia sp. F0-27]
MPYHWTNTEKTDTRVLQLWPHNSLPPQGFAAMVLGFFLFASIPLYGLLGTILLWGILPFMLAATAALYYALRRNRRDRQILETLQLGPEETRLTRRNPKGDTQDWHSATYWVRATLHEDGGPVPFYVTLKGKDREVEIGAFLSEHERKALFDDLTRALAQTAPGMTR